MKFCVFFFVFFFFSVMNDESSLLFNIFMKMK